MKKIFTLLSVLFLFAAVNVQADDWVKTEPSALQTGDVVVIVDLFKLSALPNDNGTTSAPAFTAIEVNGDQTKLTTEPADKLKWDVTVNGSNFQFSVTGTSNYLYCTNGNNGVRVGSGENNTFTMENSSESVPFLKNVGQGRYIGVYNQQDWRCYTSINNNIKDTKIAFFKKQASTDPRQTTSIDFAGGYKTKFTYGPNGDGVDMPAATVKGQDGNPIAGATVTWAVEKASGSESLVPTISGNKINIPNHSYGKLNVTASYAGDATTYQPSSKSYTIDVYKGRMNIAEILYDFENKGEEDWSAGIPTSYWQVIEISGVQPIKATVTYANGAYTYIQDENGYNLLLYGSGLGFTKGQLISGDQGGGELEALYGNLKTYNGLLELEVKENNFMVEGDGQTVTPKTLSDISELGDLSSMNAYLKIENAVYVSADSRNLTFKVGETEFIVRQNWTNVSIEGLEEGATYTLEGMGAVYNETKQLYLISFEKEDPTGINTINTEELNVNAPIYNTAGQQVNKNYKGVVIQNGKKILVK